MFGVVFFGGSAFGASQYLSDHSSDKSLVVKVSIKFKDTISLRTVETTIVGVSRVDKPDVSGGLRMNTSIPAIASDRPRLSIS